MKGWHPIIKVRYIWTIAVIFSFIALPICNTVGIDVSDGNNLEKGITTNLLKEKSFISFFKKNLIPFPKIQKAIGQRPLLMILIEFSDVDHHPEHNYNYFDDLLFGEKPSVNDYYKEVSYGKFNFTKVEILGWYKSREDLSSSKTRDKIVLDAFKQAARDKKVNYEKYDLDGDKILSVDELDVVICTSGSSESEPMGAYHNWRTKGIWKVITWDGLRFSGDVSVIQEWHTWMVCAHELGHSFNLPDFYDYTKRSNGIGVYGLMGKGNLDGTNGNHFTAWSKIKIGWIDPIEVTEDGFYIIRDSETNPEAYILLNPANKKEYFLVENRYSGDSYDNFSNSLPDNGIVIYHVDESVPKWYTPWTWFPWVNNLEQHKMLDVECSDSFSSHFKNADDLDLNNNNGDKNDLWDNSCYGFNSTSVPCNSRWYDGSKNDIGIYVLSQTGKNMTVYFSINGTGPWSGLYD